MSKKNMKSILLLAEQAPKLAAILAKNLVPFQFRLDLKSQVAFEFEGKYEGRMMACIKQMHQEIPPEELAAMAVMKTVRKLADAVQGLNPCKTGSSEELADYYINGAIEKIRELSETFDTSTKLATELKKDLDWCRDMWARDRVSLLENAGYWKKQTEELVEASLPRPYPPHLTQFRRPSERALVTKTRDEVLKAVARMTEEGRVKFEPAR